MKKIVFLDIDGVLNSDDWFMSLTIRARYVWPNNHIDPACVARLNEIVLRSGANVVLSSSWRRLVRPEEMTKILRSKGYVGPDIIDVTPVLHRPRHEEIESWFELNGEPDKFVVLDDDPDANVPNHFVWTKHKHGLTQEDVELALQILEEKENA